MRAATGGAKRIRNEKVVLIGAASSGKTSITTRFAHDKFDPNSTATVGAAFLKKSIKVDNQEIQLDIWDTGGSEKYRSLAPMYYRDARAGIIVFDVTSKSSFTEATDWINEFREKSQNGAILVAAANKVDLKDKREITPEEVADFCYANQLEVIKETSALTGEGVQELFQELGKQLLLLAPQSNFDDAEIADIAQPSTPTQSQSCNC